MSAPLSLSGKRVLLTGSSGFVGKNLAPLLRETGCELLSVTHADYDLMNPSEVAEMFRETRPEVVVHLAAYVGGILANRDRPAEFCYRNLLLGALPMQAAYEAGVKKYVTLIGGCSYPAKAESPIREIALWTGYPQPESAPYSLAKAMNVELAQSYRRQYGFDAIVLVPGNIYGPHDNFDLQASHVIPALIRKYREARLAGIDEVIAWGSGAPKRDFVYIQDVCQAIILATEIYSGPDIINISSGTRVTIKELVSTVAELTGFTGRIAWDATKPDGQMDKGFDVTRMREILGFECRTVLREGLLKTIAWFEANADQAKLAA